MHKLILILIFCTLSCFAEDLRCYQNTPLKKDTIHLIVSPDYWYLNAEMKAYFQELVQTYLIRDGHKVIERARLEEVMSETTLDQTGVVKDGDASGTLANTSSKTQLKKIGELLGADAILFFSARITSFEKKEAELREVGFRLVDCQTGLVQLAGHVKREDPLHAARLIAFTIRAASKKCNEIIGDRFSDEPDDLKSYSYSVKVGDNWYAYKVRHLKK